MNIFMRTMWACAAILFATVPYAKSQQYIDFGSYVATAAGPTNRMVRLPDNSSVYKDFLCWGYDMWSEGCQAQPAPGWILTEDLRLPPYNVPAGATGVKLHIKVKASGYTWTSAATDAALQIAVKPSGSALSVNEAAHASAQKPTGQYGLTPYALNHVEIDVPLGPDGKIAIYRNASVVGSGYLAVAVMLAGYWEPLP